MTIAKTLATFKVIRRSLYDFIKISVFDATGINNIHPTIDQWEKLLSENKIKMLNIITVGRDSRKRNFSFTVMNVLFFIKLAIIKKPVVGSNKKSCANIELTM